MIVYHSSYCIVEQPDVCHSRECLDFGKGFYVTYSREQAIKYAERFLLRRKKAFLNVYELSDNFMSSSFKRFDDYNEEWLDFVANCRKGMYTEEYDIVMGGIANDKVFRTIDLYFAGDISKDEALKRLMFEHPNNQLCLCNQSTIDQYLKFLNAEEITNE
ncbi:MAG: DUF3990 domain-containing protein [Bacteroides sp.]|nr:DUF3990 domain-containing protein [Bacteroides sp.]